jgi:hypothetical protein
MIGHAKFHLEIDQRVIAAGSVFPKVLNRPNGTRNLSDPALAKPGQGWTAKHSRGL